MQDRTTHTTEAPRPCKRAPHPTRADEALHRARLASADAAVDRSARLLASGLPSVQRWLAAREHETNLLNRARLRAAGGAMTWSDQKVLAAHAAKTAPEGQVHRAYTEALERFWDNDVSWKFADARLTTDLAGIDWASV